MNKTSKLQANSAPDEHIARKEKMLRRILVFLGVAILGYIYSDNLQAQHASQPRISIIQAVNFPNDI